MKCIKANRACGGYEDAGFSGFRLYEAYDANHSSSLTTTARKCTMPKRVPLPGTNFLPEDILPVETSQSESNCLSLRAFFYDYCIISTNPNLTRGYLSGLEKMAYHQGPESDLVKACQAVTFAAHGKPLDRPQLVFKASCFYQDLLGSLAKTIQNRAVSSTSETKFISMLLGLYQITVSDETDLVSHEAHAKGLAALMHIGNSPLDLLGTLQCNSISGQNSAWKIGKASGIFSVPALGHLGESLDDLLLSLDLLWTASEALVSSEDFKPLKNAGIALDQRFIEWEATRVAEFKPTTIGSIGKSHKEFEAGVGYWPGTVDTYFDLYVAGVWNIYRSARLLLITLILRLSRDSRENDNCIKYIQIAAHTVEDMLASNATKHFTDKFQTTQRTYVMFSNTAAWNTALGSPFEVRPAPLGIPGPNEILVKNHAIAINPIDGKLQYVALYPMSYPTILGQDVAGEVISVGLGVTRFKKGDRIAGFAVGHATKREEEKAFQAYTILQTNMATEIPDGIPYENAVVLGVAFSTAADALFNPEFLNLQLPRNPAPISTGKTLLVWGGASSVGSNAIHVTFRYHVVTIQLGIAAGYEVITTASAKNFEYAKNLGASQVFDYSSPTAISDLIHAFKGKSFVGAFDTIGTMAWAPTIEVLEKTQGTEFIATVFWGFPDPPKGITMKKVFAPSCKDNFVGKAIWEDFLPKALIAGSFVPAPDPLIVGRGLESLQEAVQIQRKGVSARKVVVLL
ncbi:hypothetical protein G7Y89_g4268 [Cudoniella acicularis]|uniref:Enoyl reductase (ER) domain-containing protein n=1 Tax=Cudoniella acicularis TaxID=354080 RepID=A0A8H4W560_9HELO|nr:hypothetical protein G7Y89_g4268 [Cudoniella acicularis]